METDSKPANVTFDRRQIYRPFLERLAAGASMYAPEEHGLIVPREHDPADFTQPPIHIAFADAAELSPGIQMALTGGIGSGKTTELLLTTKTLGRHRDAVNIFLDLSAITDLNEIQTGAILATAGLSLFSYVQDAGVSSPALSSAYRELHTLANGGVELVEPDPAEQDDEEEAGRWTIAVDVPALAKPRLPVLRWDVSRVKRLMLSIAAPLLEANAQITLLIDGLDRLIRPERFREFVEQDLQALRGTGISVVIVAPLLLWYDKSRYLHDYFDLVKRIPAAAAGPKDSAFLKQILEMRGALDLMGRTCLSSIVKASGGVIRDALTLARSAAEYAYRDAEDRIGTRHVGAAIGQLGKRYLLGLGTPQLGILRRLARNGEFPIGRAEALELLVNRQVVEYAHRGRESFAVHPALEKVLPESA